MATAWTTEEEAKRLAARFVGVAQAEFARNHKVPGGPSMLSQHIKGRRPLNLEAAMAYARGFGVPLAEISPRLAAAALNGARLTAEHGAAAVKSIDEVVREILADEALSAALTKRVISAAHAAAKAPHLAELIEELAGVPEPKREQAARAALSAIAEVRYGFKPLPPDEPEDDGPPKKPHPPAGEKAPRNVRARSSRGTGA